MSGKKTKATGQQDTQNSAVTGTTSQMASHDVSDGSVSQSAIVLPGHYIPVGSQPILTGVSAVTAVSDEVTQLAVSSLMPETDDLEVLEVSAVSERGFYRCGRFWSHQPVSVFASDDPEGDNAENNAHLGIRAECFISHDDAARLKSEPNLIVNVIDAITEKS